jgi:hypothetical protein
LCLAENIECGVADVVCPAGQVCLSGLCVIDEESCEDADGDGFASQDCGGQDCDDANPIVHPAALEVENGLDDDCDGQVDESADPVPCSADEICPAGQECVNGQCVVPEP